MKWHISIILSNSNVTSVLFKCVSCGCTENIPKEVVDFFDISDGGDPAFPPGFSCQSCSSDMIPVHYIGHTGIVYTS